MFTILWLPLAFASRLLPLINYGFLPISLLWLLLIGQWQLIAYSLAVFLCTFVASGVLARLGLWPLLVVSNDDSNGLRVFLTMIARGLLIAGWCIFIFDTFAHKVVGSGRLPALYLSYQMAVAPWPNILSNSRPAVLLLMTVQFSYLVAIGAFLLGMISVPEIGIAFSLLFSLISVIGARQHFRELREMQDFFTSIEAPADTTT